ncbi:CrcB family protein [Fusibacter paucivorans]|uniref:Fluoride-specific ion channel FluC n=1 Tax=Fusibacter paucivorans TaxID=76009 RepID=A0ABS5PM72_9FIRM|nr:CrcB family protein [Fusibacter paucivorans]
MSIKKYIYIAIGGAVGAVIRVAVKSIPFAAPGGIAIFNTLLVNLVGSFALALFLGLALEVLNLDAELRMGIGTGFMGGLTTFSTLCKEGNLLFMAMKPQIALGYLTGSIVLGLFCALAGTTVARRWIVHREVGL